MTPNYSLNRTRYAACLRGPVSSNYKGFPTSQACGGRDRVAQRLITELGQSDALAANAGSWKLMHAAILILKGWGLPRAIGMILTFVPMLGFGVWCISRAAVAA